MNQTDTQERLRSLLDETQKDVRRRRIASVTAVVAAAAVAAVTSWLLYPGTDRTEGTAPASPKSSQDIANEFVAAYTTFDRELLVANLHQDFSWGDEVGENAADMLRWNRLGEALGHRFLVRECDFFGDDDLMTAICPFKFHSLGSEEQGLEPFDGDSSLGVTVKQGRITAASERVDYIGNGFSEQVFEPFTAWVEQNHPKAWDVMTSNDPGPDEGVQPAVTDGALELWERYRVQWVDERANE